MNFAILPLTLVSVLTASVLVHAAPVPASSQADQLTGLWKNQRGTTLEITRDGADHLKGTFITAVAKTRACIGHPVPFRGVNNGNALSFSMSLEGCGSPTVIAMSGILMKKDGKDQIRTQALIQYKGEEAWDSQILTTDVYTRIDPEDKADRVRK